jgi:hypothetical protein
MRQVPIYGDRDGAGSASVGFDAMACWRTKATGIKLLPQCSAESDGLRSECMVFQSIR